MEQAEPRLAEALTAEQSWEADGVPVLRAAVTLPQIAGGSAAARRFNRYYRRYCRAYISYCKQILLPQAEAAFRAALSVSAPWEAARSELTYRVVCQAGGTWSVVCDARETVGSLPPFLLRRAEVWDMKSGLPLPLSEFFPPRSRCRRMLLRFAREETQRRIECGAVYRENWRSALRRALSTQNFYLTDDGLCFFYPLCALAGAEKGIVSFTMPYDEENGPFIVRT